jgi:ABC-type nitrate/sulfonate/bicarbonate transport system substrate-binding protein
MKTIKLGGVPEYFNLPIYSAVEKGIFSELGMDVVWQDIKEGTGAMVKYLEDGTLDMAIVLTEGTVKSIVEGVNISIVKPYVESPLVWGVHVPAHSAIKSFADLTDKKIAISRKNSGSHLMAFLLSEQLGWKIADENFVIVNNLDGARASFESQESNIFLWEKFTTHPYVNNGEFRRIAEIPTPWPCFMLVVNNDFADKNRTEIQKVVSVIGESVAQFQQNENLSTIIAQRFGLEKDKTDQIVKELRWASNELTGHDEMLDQVQQTLLKLGVLNTTINPSDFVLY